MYENTAYKREYFRIDTFLPIKITKVSNSQIPLLSDLLDQELDLKPMIINISGGGMNFKTTETFNAGDILEIKIKLPNMEKIICVFGEVLRIERTINGFNKIFIKFKIISEKIRELIVNFVFLYERETIRNNLIYQYSPFVSIALEKLIEGTFLPFDLFSNTEKGIKFFFPAGLPFDAFTKEYFLEMGIKQIYILREQFSIFSEYLEKIKSDVKVLDKTDYLSFKDYSFQKSQLHHINKTLILPKKEIAFSIYKLFDYKITPLIEIIEDLPIVVYEDLNNEQGDILIKKTDLSQYLGYISTLSFKEDNRHIPFKIFLERGKIALRYFFLNYTNKDHLIKVVVFANILVDILLKNRDFFYSYLFNNLEDFYTYVHSVNVAVLSVSLGILMNLKRQVLEKLAIASMLHDIGHNTINDELVDKQGRLTEIEYEVFKTHVLKGVWILNKHTELSNDIIEAIAHHHEKLNGSGYPMGIKGEDISLLGKIIAITDAFDLLTTKRPYRNAYKANAAITILTKDKNYYDNKILEMFIKMLVKR